MTTQCNGCDKDISMSVSYSIGAFGNGVSRGAYNIDLCEECKSLFNKSQHSRQSNLEDAAGYNHE